MRARSSAAAALVKGNDEEAVGVHGVVRVRDEPDGALGQDSGLAAARRRAHQQRTAPVFHGGALGGRPFGFAHAFSSSSVFFFGFKRLFRGVQGPLPDARLMAADKAIITPLAGAAARHQRLGGDLPAVELLAHPGDQVVQMQLDAVQLLAMSARLSFW